MGQLIFHRYDRKGSLPAVGHITLRIVLMYRSFTSARVLGVAKNAVSLKR